MKKALISFLFATLLLIALPMLTPPAEMVTEFTIVSPANAWAGESITWAVDVKGTGTYQYRFNLYRDGTQISFGEWQSSKKATFEKADPGTYRAEIFVREISAISSSSKWSGDTEVALRPAPALKVESLSNSSLRLAWEAVPGADGYAIERSALRTGPYAHLAFSIVNSYTNSGLTTGALFYYRVRAFVYTHEFSNLYTTDYSAPEGGVPLAAPSLLVEPLNGTSVSLTWTEIPYATGYSVERSLSADGPFSSYYWGAAPSWIEYDLSPGVPYYYKIYAWRMIDDKYDGPFSNVSLCVPLDPSGTPTVESLSGTSLKVTWDIVPGADGYGLWCQAGDSCDIVYNGPLTTFTDAGLTAGKPYYYWVRAYKAVGSEGCWSPMSPVEGGVPFDAPSLECDVLSGTSLRLTWTTVPLADGYLLRYSTMPDGPFTENYRSSPMTSLDLLDLTPGTPLYFRICATKTLDSVRYEGTENSATGVPLDLPAAPEAETLSGTSIRLTWPAVPGATGYWLHSYAGESSFSVYHGTSTDIVDTGLTPGTLYIYKLQAYKEAGSLTVYTAYSPEATAVPLDAPSAPVAEVIDETSVKLTWAAVFGADSCSLWQSTNPDGPFTQLYSGTSLNHTNTGLITGTPYYYKVRAHKTIGADTYYGPFSGISTAVPRDTSAMHGDANDDGEVDILDLVSIIDYIISNTPCADMANADANEDGEIDILDLVWIIDYIVGD